MKHIPLLLSIMVLSVTQCAAAEEAPSVMEFSVSAQRHQKSKLALIAVGNVSEHMHTVLQELKKDLEFGGQFALDIHDWQHAPSAKSDITQLAGEYPLAIFVHEDSAGNALDWYIYETSSACMTAGKKYQKRGALARGWAHNVADIVWPLLTGQDGFFSTKIAYCQEAPGRKGRKFKHIYIADYDGSNPELMRKTDTISMAPRFGPSKNKPLLFFSECTNENIRLKVMTMDKRSKTASDFDGVNMLPAFSADGTKVVYCASHGRGSCQLYYYDKGFFKVLTHNNGNNISPTFSEDGTKIYFCSDYEKGRPQIYCHSLITGMQTLITNGQDSCYCPTYCSKNKSLAYIKMCKGATQIYVYDEQVGEHKQLTFDKENKDECSWSPCGSYLVYGAEKGSQGRIAMMNIYTKEQRYITPAQKVCSYPTWSPVYQEFPVVA